MSYNGIIVVNKNKGIGSTDCVRIVKKLLNQKKVGHSGTLDFLATGVLVICLGKATKIIEYLQKQKKTYIADLKFGIETDTLDIEGNVISTSDEKIELSSFQKILDEFKGEITQIPPMYSALKHNGKRLYDLAREGIEIERKPRTATVYNLEILNFDYDNQTARIKTTVSAGTYIRTLIDDMGKKLDNYAHMTDLLRVESCGFHISDSIDLMNIEKEELIKKIMPIESAFENHSKFSVNNLEKKKLLNGMTVQVSSNFVNEEIVVLDDRENILGIGRLFQTTKGKMLKLIKHLYDNENNWFGSR